MSSVKQIQRTVYRQCRANSAAPMPGMLRLISDWTVMKEAWNTVASRSGRNTPGDDGETIATIRASKTGVDGFLGCIADDLQGGSYRTGTVRRFEIPKKNGTGETRSLVVLTIRDRVVHTAVKLILEPIAEATLGRHCFGFRPGCSRYDELQAVQRRVQQQPDIYRAALTTDIATCFDTLDHAVVRNELMRLIQDGDALHLLDLILRQVGSGIHGWFRRRPKGVLQGSALSPILANLALGRFDRQWKLNHGKQNIAFRYADDLIVLSESRSAANRLRKSVSCCLYETTRMKLEPRKTSVATFQEGVSLLGMQVRQHRDLFRQVDVVHVFIEPERVREIFADIDRWSEKLSMEGEIPTMFEQLNRKLLGWFQTYQYAYDAPQAFEAIDHHVFRTVRSRLKRLLRLSSSGLQAMYHEYLASGHETWTYSGVPIQILSTLSRRQYRRKRRRLPWETVAESEEDAARVDSPRILTAGSTEESLGCHDDNDQRIFSMQNPAKYIDSLKLSPVRAD